MNSLKKKALVLICFCLPLAPAGAMACGMHMAFNPDQMGFVSGTIARVAGLTPPKPVFELDHPALARASVGESNELMVSYTMPSDAENVQIKLSGTRNIELTQDVIELSEEEGSINITYELTGSGYDSITMEVTGEHAGEPVRQVARIYVRANKIASASPKVSSR